MLTDLEEAERILPRIDWQRVFLNLRQRGVPVSRSAVSAGMAWQTGEQYARGEREKPPQLMVALRLLDQHYDVCPELHSRRVLMRV